MLNRKIEQRGFGVIQGLLILVIVCLIAGSAWLTYNHYQKAHQVNSSSSSSVNTYPPMDTQQKQKQTQKSQVDVYIKMYMLIGKRIVTRFITTVSSTRRIGRYKLVIHPPLTVGLGKYRFLTLQKLSKLITSIPTRMTMACLRSTL